MSRAYKRGSRDYTDPNLIRGLKYSPKTGLMYRSKLVKGGGRRQVVLTKVGKLGYKEISVKCTTYTQHRILYLIMGYNIPPVVDHKNWIRSDNRWDNLQPSTLSENSTRRKNLPSSGYKGIYWSELKSTWEVRHYKDKKIYQVGTYNDLEEALEAQRAHLQSLSKE